MSKEHSGGAPHSYRFRTDKWEEESFEVHPVFIPDVAAGDKLSDIIREIEEKGEDATPFLLEYLHLHIVEDRKQTMLRTAMMIMRQRTNPKLLWDMIRWVGGAAGMDGDSVEKLAKKYGIKKQAFQQRCEHQFRPILAIRSQSRRDDSARELMSKTNKKQTKPKNFSLK